MLSYYSISVSVVGIRLNVIDMVRVQQNNGIKDIPAYI